MKNNLDKIRIELYGGGIFQGYVKSVSEAKQNVKSTMSKSDAKTYSNIELASREIDKISKITRGTMYCSMA